MDICLKEESGISLARELLERYSNIDVIFITGYPDLYYENVFLDVRPYGFLKKPVNEEILVSLIYKYYHERETFYYFFKTKNGLEKIKVLDIYYIESQKHKLFIHLKNEILETYGRLSELALSLPDYFLYCHKSFLVNAKMIKNYDGESFMLENREKIRISQLRQKEIRKKFMQFLDDENLFIQKGVDMSNFAA